MTQSSQGSLDDALARVGELMAARPDLAERQAEEILKVAPGDPRAELAIGMARRRRGDLAGARGVLGPLAGAQPRSAQTHFEWAMVLAAVGEGPAAIAALRHAVSLKRAMPEAWRALGDLLLAAGDDKGADAAYAEQIRASVHDPVLIGAADAMCEDRLDVAEHLLRDHLRAHPTDVAAMRMLAETGTRLARYAEVEALLLHCLTLAPSFSGARYNLAIVLYRQQKAADAIPHIEILLAEDPREPSYRNLLAACLGLVGEYGRAIEVYESVLAEFPGQPKVWLSYGHVLKTAGRAEEAVDVYNRCIAMAPELGESYWSLANLKTQPLDAGQEARMRALLSREDLGSEDRLHLNFALGKALEDRREFEAAFDNYARGARLRLADVPYDADMTTAQMRRAKALFTADFFAERAGAGSSAPDPIFVVGLPRSGSTLIEQILSSHSAVEGTMELPEIVTIARTLGGQSARDGGYPEILATLSPEDLAAWGDKYIERTRIQRKLGRTFFIDKMPNNFQHIGLIRLILPNARIIDARRNPLGACFSAFKQHFARGQSFSYDLADLGRYYADYVALMRHFDEAAPGAVHRVIYENMVEDTEGEVRRLLAYCGLPFEEGCLRFYDNARAVRTASSEQVRRPIFREGLEQWRNFEPWLGPLKSALGSTLEAWRV